MARVRTDAGPRVSDFSHLGQGSGAVLPRLVRIAAEDQLGELTGRPEGRTSAHASFILPAFPRADASPSPQCSSSELSARIASGSLAGGIQREGAWSASDNSPPIWPAGSAKSRRRPNPSRQVRWAEVYQIRRPPNTPRWTQEPTFSLDLIPVSLVSFRSGTRATLRRCRRTPGESRGTSGSNLQRTRQLALFLSPLAKDRGQEDSCWQGSGGWPRRRYRCGWLGYWRHRSTGDRWLVGSEGCHGKSQDGIGL